MIFINSKTSLDMNKSLFYYFLGFNFFVCYKIRLIYFTFTL